MLRKYINNASKTLIFWHINGMILGYVEYLCLILRTIQLNVLIRMLVVLKPRYILALDLKSGQWFFITKVSIIRW